MYVCVCVSIYIYSMYVYMYVKLFAMSFATLSHRWKSYFLIV